MWLAILTEPEGQSIRNTSLFAAADAPTAKTTAEDHWRGNGELEAGCAVVVVAVS